MAHYADNPDVVFLAIQTVFEGFGVNTDGAAKKSGDEFDLSIPVGHDAGTRVSRGSKLMRRYRTGGTPWTVIISRDGKVRANDFFISPKAAIGLVDKLLAE